jgi:hypothetical protein
VKTVAEDTLKYRDLRETLDDLLTMPMDTLKVVKAMIKAAAKSSPRLEKPEKTPCTA